MKLNFKLVLVSVFLLSFGFLVGCEHTAAGFGQDMQDNGKKIQKSVDN